MNTAECLYQSAREEFAAGQFLLAAHACRAGLIGEPAHPGLHELLGLALFKIDNEVGSLRHLEEATLLAPLAPEGRLTLAELYTRLGQVESAVAILHFLAEPGRCPTPLMPDVAKGLGRLGEHDAALGVCLRIIAARPDYHPAHFGAAFYLVKLGGPPAEIGQHLRAARDLAPHAAPYRNALAAWRANRR